MYKYLVLFNFFLFFHNTYAQTYQEVDFNLTGVGNNSVSQWVDFDNDNDLDIFIAGRTGSSTATSKLYTNVNNTFVESGIQFGWIEYGAADWGDFDNDGDADLLLSGQSGNTQPVTYIFRNDDNGKFERLDLGFVKVRSSACKWIDFDNDSDLDILISGDNNSISVTKLYQNLGEEEFTEIATELPNVLFSNISIGDYDNDGDLDLFLSGLSYSGGEQVANIFKNLGGGRFSKIENGFPEVVLGSSAWGDYDNDGDLDLALCGYIDDNFGSTISDAAIYQNNGNDQFARINNNLIKVYQSSLKWGDYDNDGDLDLLLAGRYDDGSIYDRCYLYRNDGNNTFIKTNDDFFTIFNCDADFGDYDNDGDLDIIISGDGGGSTIVTRVYKNQLASAEYFTQNAITNPAVVVNNHSASFSWQSSKFSPTPVSGQSFNIRIGTEPLAGNIMSSSSDTLTAKRKIVKLGNIQKATDLHINNLEGGVYYWAVQAIDHSYNGSKFSEEMSFSIAPWAPGLVLPLDSAIIQSIYIDIKWTSSKSADSYHLQISKTEDFSELQYNLTGIADTFYTIQNPGIGTYYWRVRAHNSAGYSEWSTIRLYKTILNKPVAKFESLQKEGRIPLSVEFVDSSTQDVNSWQWDFENDGIVDSYEKNPTWIYFKPDTHSVKLIVSNGVFSDTLLKENAILTYLDTIPNLFSIEDIPNDQGGWVKVQFAGSALDTDSLILDKTNSPELYTVEFEDGSGWTAANSTAAYGKSIYSVLVPTTKDSTSENNGLIDFRIIAGMNEGNFVSNKLSGYSIDNLFPGIPSGLSASIEEIGIRLYWISNTDEDTKFYTLYRSKNDMDYIIINKTNGATFLDTLIDSGNSYSYAVSATDFSGNESAFSKTVKVITTDISDNYSVPDEYSLFQNFPNPFNPVTKINWQIPEGGLQSLKVYDLLGREIATLVNEYRPAGKYEIEFDASGLASGIYYYRLESGNYIATKKFTLIK